MGAVVAACGSTSQQTAVSKPAASGSSIAGQTITLYNGQHEQTTDALVTAFEKQTGVNVKVRSDDEDVLAQQIEQEGTHSPADVFYTENTPPLARLDEKGLLAPVSATALADVPVKDSAADHNWVGVSARLSVLVYNTRDLKPSSAADVRARPGRPEVEGQARHRAVGDRLPADRHLGRGRHRRRRHGYAGSRR